MAPCELAPIMSLWDLQVFEVFLIQEYSEYLQALLYGRPLGRGA